MLAATHAHTHTQSKSLRSQTKQARVGIVCDCAEEQEESEHTSATPKSVILMRPAQRHVTMHVKFYKQLCILALALALARLNSVSGER